MAKKKWGWREWISWILQCLGYLVGILSALWSLYRTTIKGVGWEPGIDRGIVIYIIILFIVFMWLITGLGTWYRNNLK